MFNRAHINFMKYNWLTALFSFAIFVSFAIVYAYKYFTRGYAFTYSVEFTGGTQVLMQFDQVISAQQVKGMLEESGWSGVVTREFSEKEILVRVKEFASDAKGLAERMREAIIKSMPDKQVTIAQSEAIGSGIGKSLRTKSIQAVVLALIAMLLYIAFRFWSLSFAIGAIVSLFHDAVVILAAFLFLDREISINVIGAILAILGYSINDTIVIFSRIRENLAKKINMPLGSLVNLSINQTLRRTILTSFATSLTVLALMFLGGEALRDLSFALMIGIVFGTYSSIYIASPVMMLLHKEK